MTGDLDTWVAARDLLDADEVDEVHALLARCRSSDGVWPLSEHSRLHVAPGPHSGSDHCALHLLAGSEGSPILGYGLVLAHADGAHVSVELAVHPQHRHQGLATSIIRTVLATFPASRISLWSHGEQAPAHALARSAGFHLGRVLLQLGRDLGSPRLPAPRWPAGIGVRTFEPSDTAALLAVNAAAFPHLPDQGSWTSADLAARLAQPWYDPHGFFVAYRAPDAADILGFHWTKVHAHDDGHPPFGEVYVVAVDPAARGLGLGRALTLHGLQHLREEGLQEARLYVDRSNSAARRLYDELGFVLLDTDVEYRRDRAGRPSG